MRFVFEKTVLRVDGCLLSAADGVAVAAACPAVGFSHLEFSFDQDITLTAFPKIFIVIYQVISALRVIHSRTLDCAFLCWARDLLSVTGRNL